MDKHLLNIVYNTEFYSNDTYAFIFAILQAKEGGEVWIGNHFKKLNICGNNLLFEDELDPVKVLGDIIKMENLMDKLSDYSGVEILQGLIDKELFLAFCKDNYIQELFYGYDNKKQEVYGLKKMHNCPLQTFTIDYSIFEEEFLKYKKNDNKIISIEIAEDVEDPDILCDKDILIDEITSFLESLNSDTRSVYKFVCELLDRLDCNKNSIIPYFQKLYEHKWSMYLVINHYCCTFSDILEESLSVYDDYLKVKDAYKNIIHILTDSDESLDISRDRIKEILKRVHKEEINCLQKFIVILQKTSNC